MHPSHSDFSSSSSRRKFICQLSMGIGAAAFALGDINESFGKGLNKLSGFEVRPDNFKDKKKLGIALVGLGNYATGQLAPALQETTQCYLAGIVTGTPKKAATWKEKYNIPEKNIYNYDNFDSIKNNPDIDIIYVVLPNSMHAEYTIRAAQAGKHVISEKPMATTVEDCKKMIEACKKANRLLSIGYRLHFEPHNQRMMKLGQEKVFGKVNKIMGEHSFVMGNTPDVWRLDKALAGGGPLMDLGIYCVQGALYTLGKEPVAVTARFGEVTKPHLFDEVEQSISWDLEFPDGALAHGNTSYADSGNLLRAEATEGWFELQPAYSYGGIKGETSKGKMDLPNVNQQARQMDDFAKCIIHKQKSPVPGEMGLRDVKILMAIYEAARTGNKVKLA